MTHALVIDKQAEAKLVALKAHAEANIVPFHVMLKRHAQHLLRDARGEPRPEDPHPGHTVELRVRYAATYTIEEHREGLPCRHLSVSGPNQLPAPQAVALLMKFMGFQTTLIEAKVWTEQVAPDRHAVNVLEPMDGNWEPLRVPVEGTVQ